MDTDTSTQSAADAVTAPPIDHGAYHGDNSSLAARGHHSCSRPGNRPGQSSLDNLVVTIDGLQKEIQSMRVSNDDEGSNAEAQESKLPQKIYVFVPNSSTVVYWGTTTTAAVQSWVGVYQQVSNTQYGLSAISLNPNHMAVVSSYGASILYRTWNGTTWTDRGAVPSAVTYAKPTVVQTSPNGFELFYVKYPEYKIFHRTGTVVGEWSAHASISDQACNNNSYPVAVSRDRNLIDLFFVGSDNNLYWKSWGNMQWLSFEKLIGSCAHPGAVASNRNRIDLFALNLEGELLYKFWDGVDWAPDGLGVQNLKGSFASRPAVVSRGTGRIDVFIIGKNGRLYHKALVKSVWRPTTGFLDLGGVFTVTIPPTVVWSNDGMEIFLVGGAGTWNGLYHKRWDGIGDPTLEEFEPMLKWDCNLQPAVIVSDPV